MLYNSYQFISTTNAPINSGSYLSSNDDILLGEIVSSSNIWVGKSSRDIIELSIWDLSENLLGWGILSGSIQNSASITYLNELNIPSTFPVATETNGFIQYNNEKLLIYPVDDLASINYYMTGSYSLIYNSMRNMAGNVNAPLVIKDISPSRTEIKILPQGEITADFIAFYSGQFLIGDVYQEYVSQLSNFPIGNIYNSIKNDYVSEINTLQSIASLNSDGAIIEFINNLYEDSYVYSSNIIGGQLIRTQGIKSYFFNYLLSNFSAATTFDILDSTFESFVSQVVNAKFSNSNTFNNVSYASAVKFVHDIIQVYYYQVISNTLRISFIDTFQSPLKNALNIGDNKLYPILNQSSYVEDDGNISLIVKLKTALDINILIGDVCWISNITLAPIILNVSINSKTTGTTYKIGNPDFSILNKNNSNLNENKTYSATDVSVNSIDRQNVSISKKIKELNIDYSNFVNFIVFSSAEMRIKIFKNKQLQIANLNTQISNLNAQIADNLSQNITSPIYASELLDLNIKLECVFESFDGFESYLYDSNTYLVFNGTFSNMDAVLAMDAAAIEFDEQNRDSLIHNTPDYILKDVNNDDYIIFLSLIGHFFDNIYIYISSLPSSKITGYSETEMLTQKVVSAVLEEMGWNIDDILSDESLQTYYLNTDKNIISASDRAKIIQNRLLKNLPIIYKTKGTSTSIDLLLSCYGIPASLLNIREYGGYSPTITSSYTFFENSYMYTWSPSSPHDMFSLDGISGANSFLFKVCFNNPTYYNVNDNNILIGMINTNGVGQFPLSSSLSGSGEWAAGIIRTNSDNGGKIYFRVGYKGQELFNIVSDEFPLFDGNIYSVLIRKENVDPNFDIGSFSGSLDNIPRTYDLIIQRNQSGIEVKQVSVKYLNYNTTADYVFEGSAGSRIVIGNWFLPWNTTPLNGSFDKLEIFNNVISDNAFNAYVNNINSYANDMTFTSENLLFRMHIDYPFNVSSSITWHNANTYYANSLVNSNGWIGAYTSSYNSASCGPAIIPIYPYQFTEFSYPNTINASNYGPNQFHNEKIQKIEQEVYCRLDDVATSTANINSSTPSSNLLGIFLDPQDFKNKDIIRQFGNYNVMSLISDPSFMYSGEYTSLKQLRAMYVATKKTEKQVTLFNELMTVYRLYFNKSIFESIKKLLPARANVFSGILIEPTILERPKYEFKPLGIDLNAGDILYQEINLSNAVANQFMMGLEYIESGSFNQLDFGMNLSYIESPNTIYPNNSYITYAPDDYQLGINMNTNTGQVVNPYFPSSSLYPLKRWKKYQFSTSNETTIQPHASVYLYDYVLLTSQSFSTLIGTSTINSNIPKFNTGNHDYYQLVNGVPRNHTSHKQRIFSAYSSFNKNKKTIYKSSSQTMSGSLPILSASYMTISVSIDISILEQMSNPVFILTHDAVGILN